MVPIEPQRTHIHFDGFGDVFGALGAKLIARKVERRQRPIGAKANSKFFRELCVAATAPEPTTEPIPMVTPP